jgi:HEAT repeat protein
MLQHALGDDAVPVRVAAARALDRAGYPDQALPILTAALKDDTGTTRLWAITVLDEMDERARPAIDAIRQATKNQSNNYVERVAQTAVSQLEQGSE